MAPTDPQGMDLANTARRTAGLVWPTRLRAEIWLYRHGWALPIVALVLVLAGALLVIEVLPAQQQIALLRTELRDLQSQPPAKHMPAPAEEPEPGQAVRELLRQAEGNAAQVRRIASIARSHGISLPRAQYNTLRQTPSGIEHTDISFSFVSRYPQARSFIEGVLRELPNVSVDHVSFERDQALDNEAEVTLRLTLWRWPAESKTETEAKR